MGQTLLGYTNKERPNRKLEPNLVVYIDPVRAPLVKRMFEDYATELYSIKQVMQKATKAGLKLNKDITLPTVHPKTYLSNPFYFGYMSSNGELYKHVYEPLSPKNLSGCKIW